MRGRSPSCPSKTVSKLGMRPSRALSVMRMRGQLSVGSYQQWLRALTICIENSRISVKIQMERFISVEIFQIKGTPSEVLAFSRFYRHDRNFLYLCVSYQCAMLPLLKKWKTVFCKWYNPIPFLFSVRKTRPYLFTENFSELFAQMVSALNDLRTDQNFCVINYVILDKGQQVGYWHNPLLRLSSWFYCSTNCDGIFPCCVFVYLFCFVSWSRRRPNTTTQLPRFQFRTVLHKANLLLLLFLFCLLARFLRIQGKPKSAWTLKMYRKVTKHFSAITKQRC